MARSNFSSSGAKTGIVGSPEQEAIWNELDSTNRNVIVGALAGTGKTFTGVEWCKRGKGGRVGFVAFNKHIATELTNRLQGSGVESMTYHSLGFKLVRAEFPRVQVDQYKVDGILEDVELPIPDEWKAKQAKYRIRNLVSLAKQYGVRGRSDLEMLVDHHDVDLNGNEEVVYEWVPTILDKCKTQLSTIDFDDMIWLPKELGLRASKYDTLLIDEAQDTNLAQQWLALHSTNRLVVIGDRNQAIYGFRGSDSQSMERIGNELRKWENGVVNLPLTVTRRCPKSSVRLAQRLVPSIKWLDTACEGNVGEFSPDKAIDGMGPGDLVVCRVNAELLGVAYKLLRRGVKAVVRGRDIGEGIVKLIDRAAKFSNSSELNQVLTGASELTRLEVNKYLTMPHGRGESRAAACQDRYECLISLTDGAKTLMDVRQTVEKLFADFQDDGKPNTAVVLGTVHRTKGLEADRVWVLRPDILIHPMAKKKWEIEQERNLAYVAVTRNKKELNWVGKQPAIFNGGE